MSWISGYFIFQLFNPVLFATEGAVIAGQMGMTLAALNGIQSLSLSWMTTKIPLYSGLIAQKQYRQLDIIFNRTLRQSVFINGVALFSMFIMIYFIRYYHFIIGGLDLESRFGLSSYATDDDFSLYQSIYKFLGYLFKMSQRGAIFSKFYNRWDIVLLINCVVR